MAAVDVGGQQQFGNPILARVDYFGVRRSGLDLLDVSRFYRVTENDSPS